MKHKYDITKTSIIVTLHMTFVLYPNETIHNEGGDYYDFHKTKGAAALLLSVGAVSFIACVLTRVFKQLCRQYVSAMDA